MIRSFVAIEISDKTKDRLKDLILKFRASGADVKWVKCDNLHITLKFMGDIDEADVAGISEAMNECSLDIEPFDLTIEGLGAFPDLLKPKVIFVNIGGEIDNIVKLSSRLNDKLVDFGVKKESRKYEPHLTIGRVRSQKNIAELTKMIEVEKGNYFGDEYVDEIAFMMSELLPKGPLYSKMDKVVLESI